MKPVEFHFAAEAEFRVAAIRYESLRPGLGYDLRNELEATIIRIRASPRMYPIARGETRKAMLKRFPYSLIYSDGKDRIYVLALAHQRRRPEYWINRSQGD